MLQLVEIQWLLKRGMDKAVKVAVEGLKRN